MNVHLIVGAIMAVAGIVLYWFLWRLHKRIGRRCTIKNCGCTLKRESKILLPPDEFVSFRSSEGKLRWWIRRVLKLTFTICEKHGVKLVKIDTDLMTVWHAKFAWRYHREQYYLEDNEFVEATRKKIRELYLGGKHENLSPDASDTPPISLDTLFQGCFDEISDIIGDN